MVTVGRFAFLSVCLALLMEPGRLLAHGQGSITHQIPDLDGGPIACVVHVPQTRSATPGADRVVVDLRIPRTPGQELLGRLPAGRRDYSALPIKVFLVPSPPRGQQAALPARIEPLTADLNARRLNLTADAELDSFVRVEYARASLHAGVSIVAERTAVADSGERITSQTRCRIGVVDALVWR
jgi:hypothetical protein